MSESAPPPKPAESVEETLTEFFDTAMSATQEPDAPDGDTAESGGEHPYTEDG